MPSKLAVKDLLLLGWILEVNTRHVMAEYRFLEKELLLLGETNRKVKSADPVLKSRIADLNDILEGMGHVLVCLGVERARLEQV